MSARDDYPQIDNLGRFDDALDEIDRLRADNANLRDLLHDHHPEPLTA